MTKEEIACVLKKLRISAGFTQSQVAKKIGRKQQTLASWETGQSQPDANTLFVLCSIYGISVDEAFGFKKNSFKQSRDLSEAAFEVAEAYDRTKDMRKRDSVRLVLGLPPEPEQNNAPPVWSDKTELPLVAARGKQPSREVVEQQKRGIIEAALHAERLTKDNNDGII